MVTKISKCACAKEFGEHAGDVYSNKTKYGHLLISIDESMCLDWEMLFMVLMVHIFDNH